jgi:tetratricopeptide (TPR) repeat protein
LRNYEWGSYSAAIELFSNALFFNPNYKNGHYYRGLAYLGARIDSFALYDIMISVTTEERFAKVLNIGWKAEQINNDFKSDVWNFNLAIQLDSLHTDSLNFYSLCREQVLSTILAFEKFLVSKKQDQPLNSKELP